MTTTETVPTWSPTWERRFRMLSAALAVVVAATGLLVLVGWMLDITALRRLVPVFTTMRANSATLFVVLGIALWLERSRNPRTIRVKRLLGVFVALAGAATLAEYVFGIDFGIDELLSHGDALSAHPGRMAPSTTLMFLLIGLALSLRPSAAARALAVLTGIGALVALFGYAYSAPSLYAIWLYTALSLHTAGAFLLAACAFLLARPTVGIVSVLISRSIAGRLLRRMVPLIVIAPFLFGWVLLGGQSAGYYDAHFGIALMALSTVISLTFFSSIIATSLERSERRRLVMGLARRRLLGEMRQSEQRFRALIDASAQIVWETDANGKASDSPSWCAFTGQTHDEILGFGWLDAIHPDDQAGAAAAWRSAVRERNYFEAEYRLRHRTGEWRWTSARAVPFRDATGNISGWIGMNTDITKRKRAEAGRERQLREIVENAPHAIAVLDTELRYIEASPRWLHDFDLTTDVIGKSHYEVFAEIPEHWKAVHRRCLAGATEHHDGERFVRADGQVQWIRWKECPWRDLDGAIAGILIYSEDITAEREAHDAMRATQEQLRLAQRIARIGTFDLDLETDAFTWTPELEQMHGLPVGGFRLTQAAWVGLLHPDDRSEAVRLLKEAFATGAPTEGEWRVRWPDGSVHWLAARFQVFRDDAGRPRRLIGINMEVTEQRLAVEHQAHLLAEIRDLSKNLEARVVERTKELAIARDELEGIISLAADAIISIDSNQRITMFNRAAEEIFGWTRDEIMGKPVDVLIPALSRAVHHGHVVTFAGEQTKARKMAVQMQAFGQRKNGEQFPVETAISRLQTNQGVQFTAILRDITARTEFEAETARTHAERAVLLREIHHRVKNNLQVISSLFYLQAQRTTDETVKKMLDESRGRLQSIALIHEKLYQSQQLASIDFGDYLRDLTSTLTSAVGKPLVTLRVEAKHVVLDIDHAIPCALIVNELVTNSMKHAFSDGRRGEILISVTNVDGQVQVEVSDTGIGFPSGLDFRKVSTLGLQLVTSLTKQLRGAVELVPGPGTTFRLTFATPSPN